MKKVDLKIIFNDKLVNGKMHAIGGFRLVLLAGRLVSTIVVAAKKSTSL